MKIKRFVGSDMRQALRKVREELGPDAVILSNQRLHGEVEIVAAIDYDESLFTDKKSATNRDAGIQEMSREQRERQAALDDIRFGRNLPQAEAVKSQSAPVITPAITDMQNEIKSLRTILMNQLSGMAWEQESKLHPLRIRLMQRLMALGLSPKMAKQIASRCNEEVDIEQNWRHSLAEVAHRIEECSDDISDSGGIVALVGATGVGKTTTIAKLAARFILRHGANSVALITTDNFRVAAHEQLRSYARIMGIPMHVATDEPALTEALFAFRNKRLVLIDTAGTSQRDIALSKELSMLGSHAGQIQTYLTLAANTQRSVLDEVVEAFSEIPLAGCVLTKLDETTSLGGVLSTIIEHQLPVAYYSDGQQVPEDLHRARAHSLVIRAVSIMQRTTQSLGNDMAMSQTVSAMVAAHG